MLRRMQKMLQLAVAALWLAGCVATSPVDLAVPAHSVIGVQESHLDPEFWVQRAPQAMQVVLDASAIASQNARLEQLDASVHDIERLPASLTAAQIKELISKLSARPRAPLFDQGGGEISATQIDALLAAVNLEAAPAVQNIRFGMVVRRADLRTFPTTLRVFSSRGDTDIDRFQESALFPGTPVALIHESHDGEWWFAVSDRYAAWIEKRWVAEGDRQSIFEYTRKEPSLVVTGAVARTVFNPEHPEVSGLQLDMGVRVPLLADWPADKPVSGQHPYVAHVIELPMRDADGLLSFTPALLPKNADVARGYLTLNRANLLRQSFKFLGERYGWGHSYNARDCSGFVSEVYRSFGVQLPRNTRDQSVSPALNRIAFTEADDYATRLAILGTLQIGDLIYIPRHVMMVIGRDNGVPYVIHDTTGITYRNDGDIERVDLNGVVVTPLTPLLLGDGRPLVEGVQSIVRIRH